MKKSVLLIVILASAFLADAQTKGITDWCNTTISEKQAKRLRAGFNVAKNKNYTTFEDAEVVNVAITAHIIRRDDGTGGLDTELLETVLEEVNEYYDSAKLKFFILGDYNYIDDSRYFDFSSNDEAAIGAVHDVPNTINIYFANSARVGADSYVCGYAYFPGGPDRVVMDNGCTNYGVLGHELGHYFFLYHTHGKSNTGTTDELVNGSNCATAGDDVCDTPADPNLYGKVNNQCQYTEAATDANGDVYQPATGNIMSYSFCFHEFSPLQYQRMYDSYFAFRSYLINRSYLASFETAGKNVCRESSITFENNSLGATQYAWEFEGGEPATSTEKDPTVHYATTGSFSVKLTITTEDGETDELIKENFINVYDKDNLIDNDFLVDFTDISMLKFESTSDAISFEQSDVSKTANGKSMMMRFLEYNVIGAIDYLIFPPIDVSGIDAINVSFNYAYAYYNNSYFDKLELLARPYCSNDWQVLWSAEKDELATTENKSQESFFTPTNDQWKNISLAVESADIEELELAFRTTNGYGNNLYIDDFMSNSSFGILSVNTTLPTCFNEEDASAEIIAIGQAPLQYSLDGVNYSSNKLFTGLAAGSYTAYVKDVNEESNSFPFEIQNREELKINPSITNVNCTEDENGQIIINVSGAIGGSIVYAINDGSFGTGSIFSNLGIGEYTLHVVDENDCMAAITVQIEAIYETPEAPTIQYESATSELFIEDKGYQTIRWLKDGTVVNNQSATSLPLQGAGAYQVEVAFEGNCFVLSETLVVSSSETATQLNLLVYPNPFTDVVHLSLNSSVQDGTYVLELIDISGKTLDRQINLENGKAIIQTGELQSGAYVLRLQIDEQLYLSKIIKQ